MHVWGSNPTQGKYEGLERFGLFTLILYVVKGQMGIKKDPAVEVLKVN